MEDLAVTGCRVCGTRLPAPFLDLGAQPLANALDTIEPRFPLAVTSCSACRLVQLTHSVPPSAMFTDYPYMSSFSSSFLAHAERMAESLSARYALGPGSRVVEVGSNDGYLLQYFAKSGIEVLGIEPAQNVAKIARERGVPTKSVFFGPDLVGQIEPADLLIGNNVLAHVPDLVAFLDAGRRCLSPQGAMVFEVPYLLDFLDHLEFDTVYHEHCFYFDVRALAFAGARAGLTLVDVERYPVHGGSLRVFFEPRGESSLRVRDRIHEENARITPEVLASFGARVRGLERTFVSLLRDLRAAGRTIAAYGAPAKGSTLLNAFGVGTDLIAYAVDRNPAKQGRMMPGVGIPIVAPERLLAEPPDYLVLLPWNLRTEIVAQEAGYLGRGGKIIVPIPEVTIIGRAS